MTKHNIDITCSKCGGKHIHEKHQSMQHTNRHTHTIKCTRCHNILKK